MCCAGVEIEVFPGEAEDFAHAPSLHEQQGHGGAEPQWLCGDDE